MSEAHALQAAIFQWGIAHPEYSLAEIEAAIGRALGRAEARQGPKADPIEVTEARPAPSWDERITGRPTGTYTEYLARSMPNVPSAMDVKDATPPDELATLKPEPEDAGLV